MTCGIPRISNARLDADVQTIRALKGIPDYSAEAAEATVEHMDATATAVLLAACGRLLH